MSPNPRFVWGLVWGLLAAGSAGLALASLAAVFWLSLEPCHLCILQRLLFMILALLACGAALSGVRPIGWLLGAVTVPIAASGAGVALYQSWLQQQPPDTLSCVSSQPSLIEHWVEWLGQQVPSLFLATGFCADGRFTILGLSLANWAAIGFAIFLIVAVWILWSGRHTRT